MFRALFALLVVFLVAAAPPRPRVAITVDDLPLGGPDEPIARVQAINTAIVQTLARRKAPAVGFVNEEKLYRTGEVDARIAVLRAWLDAGFELGNHTFSHTDANRVTLSVFADDVIRGETVTQRLLAERGAKLRWFRHPFLRTGATPWDKQNIDAFLVSRGYSVAAVTVENDDWHFNAAYVAARRAGDEARAARIVAAYLAHWTALFAFYEGMCGELFGRNIDHVLLLHANAINADHLDAVLTLIEARGYTFATLDEVRKDPAYAHADSYTGAWGKSWIQRWWVSEGRPKRFAEEPTPPEWLDER